MANQHSGMTSLANQFLIAMPSLDDSYFGRSVTYICEHDDEGAMGLVVNKSTDMSVGRLLKEIKIDDEVNPLLSDQLVLAGAPSGRHAGAPGHCRAAGCQY